MKRRSDSERRDEFNDLLEKLTEHDLNVLLFYLAVLRYGNRTWENYTIPIRRDPIIL